MIAAPWRLSRSREAHELAFTGLQQRPPEPLGGHVELRHRLAVQADAALVDQATRLTRRDPELPAEGAELPPALAEMVAERRRNYAEAVEAARIKGLARLPEQAWREISSRARILGVKAEMLDDGARLHLEVDVPAGSDATRIGVPAEAAAS